MGLKGKQSYLGLSLEEMRFLNAQAPGGPFAMDARDGNLTPRVFDEVWRIRRLWRKAEKKGILTSVNAHQQLMSFVGGMCWLHRTRSQAGAGPVGDTVSDPMWVEHSVEASKTLPNLRFSSRDSWREQ